MIKVFLVDDHEVVRRGLAELLTSDPDLQVVGEAGTFTEALARIPAARPDVAVLDIRLPDGSGIDLCRELLATNDELRCLILTSFTDEQSMLDAIVAGASGYVVRTSVEWSSPRRSRRSAPESRCWTTAPPRS